MKDPLHALNELPSLISALELILFGDEYSSVTHNDKDRESISAAIKNKFSELRALINGRLLFENFDSMVSSGPPSSDANGNYPLAMVYSDSDSDKNGEYVWDGSWKPSKYGSQYAINRATSSIAAISNSRILTNYEKDISDALNPAFVSEVGGELKSLLGFDDHGRAVMDVSYETAKRILARVAPGTDNATLSNLLVPDSDMVYAVITDDENPRVLMSIDKSGNVTTGGSSYDALNIANIPVVYHIVNDGQSQSLGATSRPVLSNPGELGGCWMPAGGLTTMTGFGDLVPAGEGGNGNESPALGIATGLYRWLKNSRQITVANKRFRFAVSCPGVSATTIEKYVPGGEHYERFFTQVAGVKKAAEAKYHEYQIHAFTWTLGGSDMRQGTSYQSYYDNLLLLRSDREQRLQNILDRPVKLHAICWQNGARVGDSNNLLSLNIPNAQRYASHNIDEIHIACPYYQFKFNDGVHLTNLSSKWLGAYMQRVYREVVLLGNEWRPLEPVKITGSGNVVTAEFYVPQGRLVFDRGLISGSPKNEGFQVFDDTGELTIDDIKIIAGRSVEIKTVESLGANPRLQYGCVFENSGYAADGEHPRGTLRDTAGDTENYTEYKVDDSGSPNVLPLHNFCLTFNEQVEIY